MAVGGVTNTGQLAQGTTAKTTTEPNGALGKDAFMKLLVAQLKNQDPLNPTDAKEFVTQLSQLTSVEQMTSMTDQLKSLQAATSTMAANQASGMIGKKIEADGKSLTLTDVGPTSSGFNLGAKAETVTVTINDSTGKTIRTMELGGQQMGLHAFSWDGKDDAGTRAGAGAYTMSVSAKNAAGNPIEANAKVTGTVSGVSYVRGYPELVLENTTVPLANLITISN